MWDILRMTTDFKKTFSTTQDYALFVLRQSVQEFENEFLNVLKHTMKDEEFTTIKLNRIKKKVLFKMLAKCGELYI